MGNTVYPGAIDPDIPDDHGRWRTAIRAIQQALGTNPVKSRFEAGRIWRGLRRPMDADFFTIATRAYVSAFYFPAPCTITEVGLEIGANNAGGNQWAVLAGTGPADTPAGMTINSIGTVDTSTLGVKTLVLGTPFAITAAGWWWFGVQSTVGTSRGATVLAPSDLEPAPNTHSLQTAFFANSFTPGSAWSTTTTSEGCPLSFKIGSLT